MQLRNHDWLSRQTGKRLSVLLLFVSTSFLPFQLLAADTSRTDTASVSAEEIVKGRDNPSSDYFIPPSDTGAILPPTSPAPAIESQIKNTNLPLEDNKKKNTLSAKPTISKAGEGKKSEVSLSEKKPKKVAAKANGSSLSPVVVKEKEPAISKVPVSPEVGKAENVENKVSVATVKEHDASKAEISPVVDSPSESVLRIKGEASVANNQKTVSVLFVKDKGNSAEDHVDQKGVDAVKDSISTNVPEVSGPSSANITKLDAVQDTLINDKGALSDESKDNKNVSAPAVNSAALPLTEKAVVNVPSDTSVDEKAADAKVLEEALRNADAGQIEAHTEGKPKAVAEEKANVVTKSLDVPVGNKETILDSMVTDDKKAEADKAESPSLTEEEKKDAAIDKAFAQETDDPSSDYYIPPSGEARNNSDGQSEAKAKRLTEQEIKPDMATADMKAIKKIPDSKLKDSYDVKDSDKSIVAKTDIDETGDDKNSIFAQNFSKNELISLPDVVAMGLNKNPDVQIAVERQNQAKFFTKEGKSGYYPRVELNLKGEQQFNYPAGGYAERKAHSNLSATRAIALNQILFDGFSTIEEVRRRRQLETSAEIRTRMEEERVLLDIVKYYLQICQYQRTVVDAQNFITEMKNITDKIQIMEEAGGASVAQLDFAKARLAFAKTSLNTAVSSLNDATSNLEFLTGTLPPFFANFPDDLYLDNKGIDFYVDMAKQSSAVVLLNRSEQEALRHRLSAEKGGYYPSVNFRMEGNSSINDGGPIKTTGEGKATIQMSYVLTDGSERASIASRVKSQINELDILDRKNMIEVEKNVKLAYNQLLAKRDSLKSIDDEIKSNQTLRQLNRQNLKLGNINIMEMIDVEERLYSARSRRQQAYSDLLNSGYQLLQITGILKKSEIAQSAPSPEGVAQKVSSAPSLGAAPIEAETLPPVENKK